MKISKGFTAIQIRQGENHTMQVRLAQQQLQLMEAIERRNTNELDLAQEGAGIIAKGDIRDSKTRAVADIRAYFEERPGQFPSFPAMSRHNQHQHD
jgi:hypothetical protein